MNAARTALLAQARQQPGRVLLTGLAVLVATVFAAGTVLATATLQASFTDAAQQTPAAATVVVTGSGVSASEAGAPAPVDALADEIRALPGTTDVAVGWDAFGPVRSPDPAVRPSGTWQLVSDPLGGALSRLGPLVAGRLPTGPGEVAVSPSTAERTGAGPGTALVLSDVGGAPLPVTVVGVVEFGGAGLNSAVGLPELVRDAGGFPSQIDVAGTPDLVAVDLLAPAADVRTGAQVRAREVAEASESANAVLAGLGVFVAVALIAAIVVVASTFRIVLTRTRTQLALLRAVGATRQQITAAVLAEAVLTGLVAGLVGAGLAVALTYGLIGGLGLAGTEVAAPALPWGQLVGCVLLAVVATVAAAVGPARAAGRVPPVAALGGAAATDAGPGRAGGRLVTAGLAVLVAGAAAAAAGLGGGDALIAVGLVAVSGLALFAALIAVGPLVVVRLAGPLGRLGLGGQPGRLATANARQVPRRTASVVTVLALGVGLTAALLTALAGVQVSAEASLDEQFPAEVSVLADSGDPTDPALAALAEKMATDPRVRAELGPGGLQVDPAPGVDDVALRAAVADAVGEDAFTVSYAGDQRAQFEELLATLTAVGFGLVGMTLVVAVIGVGVTLSLSVTERTRETGLLRALGLTRGEARAVVAWEAAGAAAVAGVVGAVLGSLYGLLGVGVLGLAGDVTVPIPLGSLAWTVLGVVVVAVLAAAVPAARAARTAPVRALTEG